MVARSIGLAAGLAVAASNAFIIPSTISNPGFQLSDLDYEDFETEPENAFEIQPVKPDMEDYSTYGGESVAVNVELDCPQCEGETLVPGYEQAKSHGKTFIDLQFSLENPKVLKLNGKPIYPLALSIQSDPVTAAVNGEVDDDVVWSKDQFELGFVAASRAFKAADGTDEEVVDLTLKVITIAQQNIDPDMVQARLLSDDKGNLRIHSIKAGPSSPVKEGHLQPELHFKDWVFPDLVGVVDDKDTPKKPSSSQCGSDSSVSAMLCRLREAITDKAHDLNLFQPTSGSADSTVPARRPCPGKLFGTPEQPHGLGPPPTRGGPGKFMLGHGFGEPWNPDHKPSPFSHPHHEIPHAHGHEHHHMHGVMHGFASAIRGFVMGFVIPVLIGVAAGMAASLVGMIAGSLIAWFWVRFVRGGRRGSATDAQLAREASVEDDDILFAEKDALLDHAPSFEEGRAPPPLYSEKE